MGLRGPPWEFGTPEMLEEALDKYFASVEIEEITHTGLCIHVGISKGTFNRYHKREGYEELVTMAKLRIEHAYEIALRRHGGAGNIFALKQFGWTDDSKHIIAGDQGAPLVTKIVREIINVTPTSTAAQIEHQSTEETQTVSPAQTLTPGIDDDDYFLS